MAIMLEKQYADFHKQYLKDRTFSWAVAVNQAPHLMKQLMEIRVTPVKGHPPFKNVISHEIVKCGKIWVIVGKVTHDSIHGQPEENYELALGIDQYELAIWWDLNSTCL